ncbi:hypothetical protein [Mesorhizobium sp.]|uniref:hypothetical protein n=1 Tax=Mesorhizobium sp. TaxID=1871066 RepID=UPI0025C4D70E|nr:hypothetical protein [Mesorhizobium sp.]
MTPFYGSRSCCAGRAARAAGNETFSHAETAAVAALDGIPGSDARRRLGIPCDDVRRVVEQPFPVE